MASRFSAKIDGRKAVIKALRGLGPEATAISLKAAKDGVKVFERALANAAPVFKGKLKLSMRSRARHRPRKNDVIGWAGPTTRGAHAVFSEYGFYSVWARREIPARPWARPTYERNVSGVEAAMLSSMRQGILASARARRGRA